MYAGRGYSVSDVYMYVCIYVCMCVHVCMYVCVCVCSNIFSKTTGPIEAKVHVEPPWDKGRKFIQMVQVMALLDRFNLDRIVDLNYNEKLKKLKKKKKKKSNNGRKEY